MSHSIYAISRITEKLPYSVPVYTGAIVFQLVDDCDLERVTPTSLEPRSRKRIIEDFSFREDYAVCIDSGVRQHNSVLSSYSDGTAALIVCVDVESLAIGILQPAAPVTGACASLPSAHTAVIASKV